MKYTFALILSLVSLVLVLPLHAQLVVTENFTGAEARARVILGDDPADIRLTDTAATLDGYEFEIDADTGIIANTGSSPGTASAQAKVIAESDVDTFSNTITYDTTWLNATTKSGGNIGGISTLSSYPVGSPSHQLTFTVSHDTTYTFSSSLTSSTGTIGGATHIRLDRVLPTHLENLSIATNVDPEPSPVSGTLTPGTYRIKISDLTGNVGNVTETRSRSASYTLEFDDSASFEVGETASNAFSWSPLVPFDQLSHSSSLTSREDLDGTTTFVLAYSVTNNSSLHLLTARPDLDLGLFDLLSDPGAFETHTDISPHTLEGLLDPTPYDGPILPYHGLAPGVTGSDQSLIITCATADADVIETQIANDTFFAPVPLCTAQTIGYSPLDLTIATPVLASETLEADGRTTLHFTIPSVTNNYGYHYFDFSTRFDPQRLLNFDVTTGLMPIRINSISPNATVSPSETISLNVATAQKDDIISYIANNPTLSHKAWEYIENSSPLMPLDLRSTFAFDDPVPLNPSVDEDVTLVFEYETPFLNRLAPGHALFSFQDGFIAKLTNTLNAQSFDIHSIEKIDGEVHLIGRVITGVQSDGRLYKMGQTYYSPSSPGPYRVADPTTLQPHYAPLFETNYPPATQVEADRYYNRGNEDYKVADAPMGDFLSAFRSTPMVISELELAPGVFINGQVLVRAAHVDFEYLTRGEDAHQLQATFTSSLYLNLVIDSRIASDNLGLPDQASTLFELELFPIVIPTAVPGLELTITPSIKFDAGLSARLPSKVSIPIQTGVTIGTRLTYHRGEFESEKIQVIQPPFISKSELQKNAQAELSAWIEASLNLKCFMGSALNDPITGISLQPIEGHAGVKGRFETNFLLDPLGDPWWSLEGNLSLGAYAFLESFGDEIVREEAQFGDGSPLFQIGANGPRPPEGRSRSEDLAPALGSELRWATVVETDKATVGGSPIIEPLPGDHSLMLTSAIGLNSATLTRLDEKGNTLWHLGVRFKNVTALTSFPDGSALLISGDRTSEIILTKIDGNGAVVWNKAHHLSTASGNTLLALTDAAIANESGDSVIYVCGEERNTAHPLLLKFDANGDLLFQKTYPHEKAGRFNAIHLAQNGDLLLAGQSRITPESQPSVISWNGLLSRIGTDGSQLWSRFIYSWDANQHFDLAEDPATGDIYTVGHHFGTVVRPHTGIQVCKWTSDGLLHRRVILEPEVPGIGTDAYNDARSCFFAHNSLFLSGQLDIGRDARSFVCRLTPQLGILFFTTLEGPHEDGPSKIAPLTEGFLLSSNHASLNPWGGDGSTISIIPGSGSHTLVTLLPWEGFHRFNPLSQLQPTFHKAYSFPTFEILDATSTDPLLHVPGLHETFRQQLFSVTTPFESDNSGVIASAQEVFDHPFDTPIDLTATSTTSSQSVSALDLPTRDATDVPADAVASYSQWEELHSLTPEESAPGSDPDGDTVPNILEAFTGTNPLLHDAPFSLTLKDQLLTVPVSPNARFLHAEIQTAPDLVGPWSFFSNPVPMPPSENILSEIPFTTDQPRQFLRLMVTDPE